MGLFDLFKSAQERRMERRKAGRSARRKAENALQTCEDRIRNLEANGKKIWAEVINYLKSGQQMFAERAIKKYRWQEMIVDQLERKKFVFEKFMIQLENAETDQVFAEALSAINSILNINPEKIITTMENMDDNLAEQTEIDRYYNKAYDGEMNNAEYNLLDRIPSMTELMRQAEAEATGQVINPMAEKNVESSVSNEIGKGREAIQKAFEESEKK